MEAVKLNPAFAPETHYILINPDGSDDGIEYKSWHELVSEARDCDDIAQAVEASESTFRDEFEGYKHGEHFDMCWTDYLESEVMEEILNELGYRVLKVIRKKEKGKMKKDEYMGGIKDMLMDSIKAILGLVSFEIGKEVLGKINAWMEGRAR